MVCYDGTNHYISLLVLVQTLLFPIGLKDWNKPLKHVWYLLLENKIKLNIQKKVI